MEDTEKKKMVHSLKAQYLQRFKNVKNRTKNISNLHFFSKHLLDIYCRSFYASLETLEAISSVPVQNNPLVYLGRLERKSECNDES